MLGLFTSKIVSTASLVALVVVGSFAGWTYLKLQKAEKEKVEALAARDEAATARDKAIEANKTNLDTIDQLMMEKLDIEKSLASLEADRRRNQQIINNLSSSIKAMAADPANQAKLSPVLKATVDAIQKQRDERVGGVK